MLSLISKPKCHAAKVITQNGTNDLRKETANPNQMPYFIFYRRTLDTIWHFFYKKMRREIEMLSITIEHFCIVSQLVRI